MALRAKAGDDVEGLLRKILTNATGEEQIATGERDLWFRLLNNQADQIEAGSWTV